MAAGHVIPLHPRIRALTLRVILRAIFGDGGRDARSVLHERVCWRCSRSRPASSFRSRSCAICPAGAGHGARSSSSAPKSIELIYALIARRRARSRAVSRTTCSTCCSARRARRLADVRREIRDNLMSMILAGHETTTGELAWAFQLLAHNPPSRTADRGDRPTATGDEYLTATVHETLRHKPVFLFAIPREVIEPIEIGGWTYRPPGSSRGCTYLMHHDPELYPGPARVPPRALHRRSAAAADLAAVGWRPQALPRPALRAAGGQGGLREVLVAKARAAREHRHRAPTLAQRDPRASRWRAGRAAGALKIVVMRPTLPSNIFVSPAMFLFLEQQIDVYFCNCELLDVRITFGYDAHPASARGRRAHRVDGGAGR